VSVTLPSDCRQAHRPFQLRNLLVPTNVAFVTRYAVLVLARTVSVRPRGWRETWIHAGRAQHPPRPLRGRPYGSAASLRNG
jgi:hypothetical protein